MARKNLQTNTTISFKSVGEKLEEWQSRQETIETPKLPIGIKTPLNLKGSGLFEMHYDLQAQVRDNFKNLLLTNKGERLRNYNFGADLHPLAAEKLAQEDFDKEAMFQIREAVTAHMPFLELKSMSSETKTTGDTATTVHMLTITYDVPSLRVVDDKLVVNIICIG